MVGSRVKTPEEAAREVQSVSVLTAGKVIVTMDNDDKEK